MMAMNRADYHPDWPNISRQIRAQAHNRCEFCGVENGETGARAEDGSWIPEDEIDGLNLEFGVELFGDTDPKIIKIVLTTAHLCHDKRCIDPTHLRSLCQRCHLNLDRDRHIANRRRNAVRKSGQQALEGFDA